MTASYATFAKPDIVEWYTNWRNRGYLAPESIAKMPIVKERWRELSEQLTRFKSEEFKR